MNELIISTEQIKGLTKTEISNLASELIQPIEEGFKSALECDLYFKGLEEALKEARERINQAVRAEALKRLGILSGPQQACWSKCQDSTRSSRRATASECGRTGFMGGVFETAYRGNQGQREAVLLGRGCHDDHEQLHLHGTAPVRRSCSSEAARICNIGHKDLWCYKFYCSEKCGGKAGLEEILANIEDLHARSLS